MYKDVEGVCDANNFWNDESGYGFPGQAYRGDLNDLAVPLREHHTRRPLAEIEDRGQVDLQNSVEISQSATTKIPA